MLWTRLNSHLLLYWWNSHCNSDTFVKPHFDQVFYLLNTLNGLIENMTKELQNRYQLNVPFVIKNNVFWTQYTKYATENDRKQNVAYHFILTLTARGSTLVVRISNYCTKTYINPLTDYIRFLKIRICSLPIWAFKHVENKTWHESAIFKNSWPSFCQIWIIFTHLKLWIASARHNFKWVKTQIE